MNFASSDEDPNSGHPAFGMMAHRQQMQEQIYMQQIQQQELRVSIERFLDGLNAEQALGLAKLLTLFNDNPGYQHVVYGQLSSIMRLVHKICATCGDTKHSTMEHLTAEAAIPIASQEPDYKWLIGLSPAEQVKRLNVTEHLQKPGTFTCYSCQNEFSTLFDRASTGHDCHFCTVRANILADVPDENLGVGELYFRYRVAESTTQEDGCYCFDCFTEFPTMRMRMDQGLRCPVCAIQTEASHGGS